MKRNWTERVIVFVVVVFLAVMGYQIRRFFYQPISVDTLYEYTVHKSLQTKGIAVREESLLGARATGAEYYPVEDGGRVALDETVAEVFQNGRTSNDNIKRARELENEIRLLEEAQMTRLDYSITEDLNRDIKLQLGELAAMSCDGRYSGLDSMRETLSLHINKKQVSNGKETDFEGKIQQLNKELASLRQGGGGGSTVIQAPFPGYFSKVCDGYEELLTPDSLETMSLEELENLIETPTGEMTAPRVGRMVHSEKWTFVVMVPAEYLEWIRVGQKMELHFDQVSQPVSATVGVIMEEKGKDKAALLLSCNQVNQELINLRVSGVTIQFQQFTGIRVNSKYLRFQPNKEGSMDRGVFVLDDHVVRFRKLDILYEEEGFILTKTYYNDGLDEGNVRLFDQVITKGTDLYDGKTMQDY